ncbi:Ca(2+)-dependent cysteine protease [Nowakowskiella sp. JEL0407]|nr:Ca(2+)-dependent cysteine protease [Nowakowskiella sp. JEL0407]
MPRRYEDEEEEEEFEAEVEQYEDEVAEEEEEEEQEEGEDEEEEEEYEEDEEAYGGLIGDPDTIYEIPESVTRRRALFVGINYFGTDSELGGCINDVQRVSEWIQERSPFEETMFLTDDNPDAMPTKQALLEGLHWLVEGAQEGDALFFHYSGHGGTTLDHDGEEDDGLDSTLCPVDYLENGQITDDDVHFIVSQLPAGARLTAIMDCCHSGSILDLPYQYTPNGDLEIQKADNRDLLAKLTQAASNFFANGDSENGNLALKKAAEISDKKYDEKARARSQRTKTTDAFIVSFSGCMDNQTSADATIEGARSGALSWALIEVLRESPNITYAELLKEVRTKLKGQYTQIPQLSVGYPIDLENEFDI